MMIRSLLALILLLPAICFAKPELSQRDYRVLTTASKLLENEEYDKAYQHLHKAQQQLRNKYALALVAHNLGQIELIRERYPAALEHLETAYRLDALDEAQQLQLSHSLAQLNCMEEHWRRCIDYLKGWMSAAPDQIKGKDYLLLAQAYAQLEKWSALLGPIDRAIASRKKPPQSWFQLKLAAHIKLRQWKSAISTQKTVLSFYAEKPENWRQLVSLYLQRENHRQALATQRMGFDRGLLQKARDYRLLTSLMLQAEIPFFAGQVMQQGLDNSVLKANERNLKLLGRCWIEAREYSQAILVLQRLNTLKPSTRTLTQLAQLQLQQQDWESAKRSLTDALDTKPKDKAKLQLLLGIAQIKLKHYRQAKNTLLAAASDERLKPSVEGWLYYLDQVNPDDSAAS